MFLEISYLNADMRKFKSSQKEESRIQSADSSTAYSKSRTVCHQHHVSLNGSSFKPNLHLRTLS